MDKINHKSVVNEVLSQLTDSIVRGDIRPGDRIPAEMELMEQLGVGRNSIREAIKMLVAMGVLEVRRGSGTFVATEINDSVINPLIFSLIIEPKSSYELYEFRKLFDTMIILLVIDRVEQAEIDQLRSFVLNIKSEYTKNAGDIDRFVEADLQFHKMLLELTQNRLFIRLGSFVMALFPQYIKRSLSQPDGILRSIRNHMNIVDIITNRDKFKVFEVIESSLSEWKQNWET